MQMKLGDLAPVASWADTLKKAFGTVVEGVVQYKVGTPIREEGVDAGGTQGTLVPDTGGRNLMLGIAAGLAGLLLFMQMGKGKRRRR
jgi:hypothetical protein